jgi:hydrogenase large subunit
VRQWLDELESCLGQPTLQPPQPADIDHDAQGFGHANATRGTLMHWVKLSQGKIATYQVITPTTWNASPRDSHAVPGHFEQSLVGLPAGETGRGIRALVSGSHDPASSAPRSEGKCAPRPRAVVLPLSRRLGADSGRLRWRA